MKFKKYTLLTTAVLASIALGGVVSADQKTPDSASTPAATTVTATEATATTETPATDAATTAAETASETSTTAENTTTATPEASTPAAEVDPVASNPASTPAAPAATATEATTTTAAPATETATPAAETAKVENKSTEITKSGTEITVKNPEVKIEQPNGNGLYSPFKVEYKNIKFADDMAINEGDKVIFTLPQEVKLQTSYTFDVFNPEKLVVGKATADASVGKIVTVFNDYFKTHPLNKQMSLELDTSWTSKVEAGKPVTANFNGTLVTVSIGKNQEIGKDELLSKWGFQDKNDPTIINWSVRINYAKRVLNYVKLIDTLSDNQKLIDDYFVMENVESVDPWVTKGDAMNLVKSMTKSEHGFEITMDRLDHMIYMYYRTKLTKSVAESTNPTNKIELKAETDGAISKSYVQLVGGKGDASGENKPETPKVPEKPKTPEKPKVPEKPKTPEKPKVPEKPKTPEKPKETPKKPNTPEPKVPEKPKTPEKPKETPKKPNTPEPKVPEKPKVPEPKKVQKQATFKIPVKYPTVTQKPAAKTLPHTGESNSNFAAFVGGVLAAFAVSFGLKTKNTKKETE